MAALDIVFDGVWNDTPDWDDTDTWKDAEYVALDLIADGETGLSARNKINAGFTATDAATAALADKLDTSALDTDSLMAANSDDLIPSQKAVKAAIAAAGGGGGAAASFDFAGDLGVNDGSIGFDWLRAAKLRQGFANVLSNTGPFIFAAAGDSTTAGTTGGIGTTATTSSWPWHFYKELLRQGVPARYDGFYCGQRDIDTRLVVGAGWGVFSAYLWTNPGNLTSAIESSFTGQVDRAVISYYDNGTGTLRYQWDSATAVDIALTGDGTLKNVTVNVTLGTHTLKVFMNAGIYIGCRGYATSINDVQVLNLGYGGTGANTEGTAFSIEKIMARVGANFYDLNYGINNYGANAPTTFGTSITTMVTAFQAIGAGVALNYPTASNASEAVQESYYAQLKLVAAAKSCPLNDLHQRYGRTFAEAGTEGWVTDALHPTVLTYADQGRWKAKKYLSI